MACRNAFAHYWLAHQISCDPANVNKPKWNEKIPLAIWTYVPTVRLTATIAGATSQYPKLADMVKDTKDSQDSDARLTTE